jgi:hypothetical protein
MFGIKAPGRVINRPPAQRQTLGELAPITTNRVNLNWLQDQDPKYLECLKVIREPEVFKSQFTGEFVTRTRVSRGMRRLLPSMLDFNVVGGHKPTHIMKMFTTEKKNGLLRLILDCRPLNDVFARPPEMDLPRITQVIDDLMKSEWVAQADAVSYFYQFPLHPDIARYFGARLGQNRGDYTDICMLAMPMGWSWAPSIGQRVANTLVRDCGLAWVDNFLITGKDRETFESARSKFLERVKSSGLQLDSEELQPQKEFVALGIDFDIGKKQYRMDPKWVAKVMTKWDNELDKQFTNQDAYALAGALLWRCQVLKKRLCTMPHTLSEMGRIGRRITAGETWEHTADISQELREEWRTELKSVEENPWVRWGGESRTPTAHVWSDASDHYWCFLLFEDNKVVCAKRGSVKEGLHIYYSELSAALGGIVAAQRRGHTTIGVHIDNAPAAMALRRGLSTNFKANRWLGAISHLDLDVHWVPSAEQLADPYTRATSGPQRTDLLPLPIIGTSITELGLQHSRL